MDASQDWIIENIVPRGEPWLLVGKWKGGKTWVELSIAISVALGIPWLTFPNRLGRPGHVLIVALEDSRRRINSRLWQLLRPMGLRLDDPTLRAHLRITDASLRLPRDQHEFIAELNAGDWKPDLILVDSLSRVFTGSQNNIDDATNFTDAWGAIGMATRASVAFIHHTKKGWEGSELPTLDDVRGSGDLAAFPRHLVMMKRLGPGTSSAVLPVGNLEITREAFVLEYQRAVNDDGRASVVLSDRGDASERRDAERRDRSERKKHERDGQKETRYRAALSVMQDTGTCSASALSAALTKDGDPIESSTAGKVLASLKDLKYAASSTKGYTITAAGRDWLG